MERKEGGGRNVAVGRMPGDVSQQQHLGTPGGGGVRGGYTGGCGTEVESCSHEGRGGRWWH